MDAFGPVFIGSFDRDLRAGPGRVLFANGDVFVGTFEADAAQGPGVLYFVQKHTKLSGYYQRGECKNG